MPNPCARGRTLARFRPWGGRELGSGDRDAGSDKRLSVGSSRIPILSLPLPVGLGTFPLYGPAPPSVRPATDCRAAGLRRKQARHGPTTHSRLGPT